MCRLLLLIQRGLQKIYINSLGIKFLVAHVEWYTHINLNIILVYSIWTKILFQSVNT